MKQAKQDCTQWLQDELMNHLQSGRFTPEQITEAVQEMHDRLRDPEEAEADETGPPMTQERLNAIWAQHEANWNEGNFEEIEEAFLDEVDQHGGEAITWTDETSDEDVIGKLIGMLHDRGCVVLDNPAAEAVKDFGYVVFWPEKLSGADASSDQDEAPATVATTAK